MTTRVASPFNAAAVGLYIAAAVQGLLQLLDLAAASALTDMITATGRSVWALVILLAASTSAVAAIASRRPERTWTAVRVELYTALAVGALFCLYWWSLADTTKITELQTTKTFALALGLSPIARSVQIFVELTKAGFGAARQFTWLRRTRLARCITARRQGRGARRATRRG